MGVIVSPRAAESYSNIGTLEVNMGISKYPPYSLVHPLASAGPKKLTAPYRESAWLSTVTRHHVGKTQSVAHERTRSSRRLSAGDRSRTVTHQVFLVFRCRLAVYHRRPVRSRTHVVLPNELSLYGMDGCSFRPGHSARSPAARLGQSVSILATSDRRRHRRSATDYLSRPPGYDLAERKSVASELRYYLSEEVHLIASA